MKRLALALAAALLLAACGGDDASNDDDASTTTTTAVRESPSTTAPSTSTQVAMWPAADIVFATPEEAAKDFVSKVFDVPPTLGAFKQGDARSGEIAVFSPGEGAGGTKVERGTLVLRQLGSKSGWYVISAGGEGASITNLSTGDEVAPGKVTVQGAARGFEGNVVVSAYVAGDDVELTKAVTQGGSMAETQPFTVSLDLSGAIRGTTVFIVVRGGVGLETDPGEFAAIPLVVR